MLRYYALQQLTQIIVHAAVFIWDIQADNLFAGYDIGILFLDPPYMLLLHAEDHVCPSKHSRRYLNSGIGLRSGRTGAV